MNRNAMTDATELRRALHASPELSGREHGTAERIREHFAQFAPDETVTGLGGAGLAVAFGAAGSGPTVLLRAELDALPIAETNTFPHRSRNPGASHKCGHDGHMAILAAVAGRLAAGRPRNGRVVFLFQPAEETGAGAAAVLADPRFARVRPDLVFALHNLPGWPLGQVVVREGPFTCASRGMTACMRGRPAHAATPETGASPALALARTLLAWSELPHSLDPGDGRVLTTIVGMALGGRNFGIAPDLGELHVTLRSVTDATMERLVAAAESVARAEAAAGGLALDVGFADVFHATVNAPRAVALLREACAGLPLAEAAAPMRWSEDFGLFTQVAPGALFGLGAGEECPALHSDDYDFPDALIERGSEVLLRLVRRALAG